MSTTLPDENVGDHEYPVFRLRNPLADNYPLRSKVTQRIDRLRLAALTYVASSSLFSKFLCTGAVILFSIAVFESRVLVLWVLGFFAGVTVVAFKTGKLLKSLEEKLKNASQSKECSNSGVRENVPNSIDNDIPWLNNLIPSKFDHSLCRLCETLLNEFVYKAWYQHLAQNGGFGRELRYLVRFVVAELIRRALRVDLHDTLRKKLPVLIARHLNDYVHVRSAEFSSDADIKSRLVRFSRQNAAEHAAFSDDPHRRLSYYTDLADKLIEVLFHTANEQSANDGYAKVAGSFNTIACKILKRILAAFVITPAVDALSKPQNVNKIFALLLVELNEPPEEPFVSVYDTLILENYKRPPSSNTTSENKQALAQILQNDDLHNLFRRFLRTIERENLLDFYVRASFVDKQLADGDADELREKSNAKSLAKLKPHEISQGLLRSLQVEVRKLFQDYAASPLSPKWICFHDAEFHDDVARILSPFADPELMLELRTLPSWRRAQRFVYSLLETEYLPPFQHSTMLYKSMFGPRTDEVEYKFNTLPSFLQHQQSSSFVRNPIGSLTSALVGVFRALSEINPAALQRQFSVGMDDGNEQRSNEQSEIASETSSSISQRPSQILADHPRRPSVFYHAETVRSVASDDAGRHSGMNRVRGDRASSGSQENLLVCTTSKTVLPNGDPYATLGSRESLHDDLTERLYGRRSDVVDSCPKPDSLTSSNSASGSFGRPTERNFDLNQLHVCVPTIETRQQRDSDHLYYVYVIKVIAPRSPDTADQQTAAQVDAVGDRSIARNEEMWYVERKYEEFYVLQAKLREFHGMQCLAHAALPSKRTFLLTPTYQYLSARKHNMEHFLRLLIAEPRLRKSQLLYSFLTADVEFNKLYVPDYATSFRLVIPGRTLFNAVPKMLYVEKGQNLRNFINKLGVSIVNASGLVPGNTVSNVGGVKLTTANRSNYAATRSSICSSNSAANFEYDRASQTGAVDVKKQSGDFESKLPVHNSELFDAEDEFDELEIDYLRKNKRNRLLNHHDTVVGAEQNSTAIHDRSSLAASQGYFSQTESGKSRLFEDFEVGDSIVRSRAGRSAVFSFDDERESAERGSPSPRNDNLLTDSTRLCCSISRDDSVCKDTTLTREAATGPLMDDKQQNLSLSVQSGFDSVQLIDVDSKPLLPANMLLSLIRLIYSPPESLMQPLTALILHFNDAVDDKWNAVLELLENYLRQPEHFVPLIDLLIETLSEDEPSPANDEKEERKSRAEFRQHLEALQRPYWFVLKLVEALRFDEKSNLDEFGATLWETFCKLLERFDGDAKIPGKTDDAVDDESSPPRIVGNSCDVVVDCFQCESFNRRLVVTALDALIAAFFPEIA